MYDAFVSGRDVYACTKFLSACITDLEPRGTDLHRGGKVQHMGGLTAVVSSMLRSVSCPDGDRLQHCSSGDGGVPT